MNIVSFKNHRQKSPVQEYGRSSADLLAGPRPHPAAVRPAVGGQEVFLCTVTADPDSVPGGFKIEVFHAVTLLIELKLSMGSKCVV